jgi:hypothetical protein
MMKIPAPPANNDLNQGSILEAAGVAVQRFRAEKDIKRSKKKDYDSKSSATQLRYVGAARQTKP